MAPRNPMLECMQSGRTALGVWANDPETVELCAFLIGAIARQEFDILDRQEQPVIAGIHDEETIMRRALHLDRL